jgi:hypothetical protein
MLLCLLVCGALAVAVDDHSGVLNVKDFGAVGNGGVDDTAAIQAAFNALETFPSREIVFPAGNYRVTETITIHSPHFRGEGSVNINMADPKKDIFYVKFAWRGKVSGITFHGGAKQLNMRNIRVDQGLMMVEDCSFNNCTDYAIFMEERSNPMHLIIRGCHFNQCEQVLYTPCDWTTFSDSWITTAYMKDKAAIVNAGAKLLCENIVGVPLSTGLNDRWIDNYGNLTCKNFRFGGEFGGMTSVYNFSKLEKTLHGAGVILEDCYIAGQGSGRKCAIYCIEIPSVLVIRNSALTVPAVRYDESIDLKQYFKHVQPGVILYDLLQNTGESNADPQTVKLLKAAEQRDTSLEPVKGQWSAKQTKVALAKLTAYVKNMPAEPGAAGESNGHKQKTNPADYRAATLDAKWDLSENVDALPWKCSDYLAVSQIGEASLFLHRAPATWQHAILRNIQVDLDKYPWISWKQRTPYANPFPPGLEVKRDTEELKIDPGIIMPIGYALRITDNTTGKMVLLREMHTPPWDDYQAVDLRKLFGIMGGKRTFTIKYFPLGVYITGMPGSGFALPGEYQILEFIRFEKE